MAPTYDEVVTKRKRVVMLLDDSRKLAMVQHVVHDWAKLVEIHTTPPNLLHAPLNHAVERAFLVEARKLANFFKNNRGPINEDAISKDYVEKGKRFKPKLPKWKEWHQHLNAHLMHLSYERVDNTVPWNGDPNEQIFGEMLVTWEEFLTCVDPKFAAEFDRHWQAAKARAAHALVGR